MHTYRQPTAVPHPAGTTLPAVVHGLAAAYCQTQLHELFTEADDQLFDMADRALSNQEQNSLFEAMRELRVKQPDLLQAFLHQLDDAFTSLLNPPIDSPTADNKPGSHHDLSLVQHDELEESVTLNALAKKSLERDGDLLHDLNMRMQHILAHPIELKNNPLAPARLGRLFLHSLSGTGFEQSRVRLFLLRLFDQHVLNELAILYDDCNQHLIDAGVLPQLRGRAPADSRQTTASRKSAAASPQESAPVNPPPAAPDTVSHLNFSAIQALLHTLKSRQDTAAVPANAVSVSTGDLVQLLTHLQQHNSSQPTASGLIRRQLDGILQRVSQQSQVPRQLTETDNDAIDLVSMLFDFILDDPGLPDSLKAIIGRLQIPFLKVAIAERSFFDSASHPARQLLNQLGQAALGWSSQADQQRDKLYQKIEEITFRLLHEFTDDFGIFDSLLDEFNAFLEEEQRRSALVEQRVKDTEDGRARTETARSEVDQQLHRRMAGQVLPETLVRLLNDNWSQVLLLYHLRQGTDSSLWQKALQRADDLIWSAQPLLTVADGTRLQALIPSLLADLRQGFEEAGLDPVATSRLLSELDALYQDTLHNIQPAGPASAPGTASTDQTATTGQTPPRMVKVAAVLAPAPPDAQPENEPAASPATLAQVDQFRPGSWFEWQQTANNSIRCKLSAYIRSSGRYIFVNRHGMKVLDKSRNALALMLETHSLRLLDDALLFDRALESVIGNLRRMKSEQK